MGFRVDIEGLKIEIADYSVEEASSPLAAGDSSGSVGSFTVTLPVPDPHIPLPTRDTPWKKIRTLGPEFLIDKSVRLYDSRKGTTSGRITSSQVSYDGATVTFSGVSDLNKLNFYNFQVPPIQFTTLEGAFYDYFNWAGLDPSEVSIDVPLIYASLPGWKGEFWYYMKLLAAAYDLEISLVEGLITVRPLRQRTLKARRDTSRARSFSSQTLAQSVEVYQYNNQPLFDGLAYPPGGWSPEVEILNVNAGEDAEYTLELSSSLFSIQEPTMQTFVAENHSSSSVYTVVANDGLPVTPEAWSNHGGSVEVEIGDDTKTLVIRLHGATGLPTSTGEAATSFSLALASDTSGNRYSTLRIVGSGVVFDKQKKRIRTGISETQTATDVGVTIDNPFISNTDQLYKVGIRGAKEFAGPVFALSGSVASLDGDSDPVFGNVAGSRVFDRNSKRWYRIRNATLTQEGASIGSADDDLTWGDVQAFRAGRTYAQVQAELDGFTYAQVERRGLS